MAVQRVAGRVRHGGHSVPSDHIRRRYERGLSNFFKLYSPIADSWEMHENTSRPPVLVAMKDEGRPVQVARPDLWENVLGRMRTNEKDGVYETGAEPRFAGVPVGEVMAIFDQSGREALARHKALGIPVVIWRDGKVVEVPPEEIKV